MVAEPAEAVDLADRLLAGRLLVERIRHCVPLRHPAFGKLLQLLAIEPSREVPTAAVTLGARSVMLVNPEFVAARCRTDAHLAMLVMHELYHVLLGHTRLYTRSTPAANWAFDCIINAQLCRLHPSVEYTSFFSAAAAAEGPWSLIGPPPGWPDQPRYAAGALGAVHRRLYDDAGATTAELFALLDGVGLVLGEDGDRLLGDHRPESTTGDPLHADPDLHGEVRRIVARWPMVERRGGTDDGGPLEWVQNGLRKHAAARQAIRALLARTTSGEDAGPWLREAFAVPSTTPLPQGGDRRAQLQRSMGATPLLWNGELRLPALRRAGQVAVYLDVSGSMSGWLPVLLQALNESSALVRWPVYGFSTAVHPLARSDLAAGRVRSDGGTDIACVVEHLLQQRIRRAVIVTDGEVGRVGDAQLRRLRDARPLVRVGLLDGCDAGFCAALGWTVTRIPPLDRNR